jgi:hypothetical protein
VLPPKMGEGVAGSNVGGFHGAFSSATALLSVRARRGAATLLRTAVPWKLLCRDGAEQRGAAVSIIEAIAAALCARRGTMDESRLNSTRLCRLGL